MSVDHVVVLVGLMGSGKTSVASAYASITGSVAVDLDVEIANSARMDVRAMVEEMGEATFRRMELSALCRVLEEGRGGVVACGGGVVTTALGRARLRAEDHVVFLDVSVEEALARLGDELTSRPLLDGDARGRLEALAAERRGWYLDVADAVVDVDDKSVEQLADEILVWLRGGS